MTLKGLGRSRIPTQSACASHPPTRKPPRLLGWGWELKGRGSLSCECK